MNEYSADYNHAEAVKSIRSLLSVIGVAYVAVIAVWLIRSTRPVTDYIALTLGLISLFFLLWYRLRIHREGNQKIALRGDSLLVPALFFMNKVIPVNKLCSVKPTGNRGNDVGLWIGIRNRQAYILYERLFAKREDFLVLADILDSYIRRNLTAEEHEAQALIGSEAKAPEILLMLVLIIVWVAVYLLGAASFSYVQIGDAFLVAGANTKSSLSADGLYRLFSSFFLHGSILHLLLNVTVFSQFGHVLIRMIGAFRFLNILLFTSLAGTIASSIYSPYAMSIGASGGLYGLFAAYLYLKDKFNNYLPAAINAASMTWLIGVLCVDFFCALFIFSNIDVVNHVSGFAAGYCWCLLTHPGLKVLQSVKRAELLTCVTLVLLYGYGLVSMLLKVSPA